MENADNQPWDLAHKEVGGCSRCEVLHEALRFRSLLADTRGLFTGSKQRRPEPLAEDVWRRSAHDSVT